MARQSRTVATVGRRQVAAARRRLAELAEGHAEDALAALVEIALEGGSEAARVSAANAILDRAYGKPGAATANDMTGPPDAGASAGDLSDDELARIAIIGSTGAAAPPPRA